MKKIAISLSVVLLASMGFSEALDARPGKGRALGHYKNGKAYSYTVPNRGYYAAPRYSYRRSNRDAVAAGVAGAIIGGALGAAAQPSYRSYERPSYGYSAPRSYYSEEYYYDDY